MKKTWKQFMASITCLFLFSSCMEKSIHEDMDQQIKMYLKQGSYSLIKEETINDYCIQLVHQNDGDYIIIFQKMQNGAHLISLNKMEKNTLSYQTIYDLNEGILIVFGDNEDKTMKQYQMIIEKYGDSYGSMLIEGDLDGFDMYFKVLSTYPDFMIGGFEVLNEQNEWISMPMKELSQDLIYEEELR